MADDDEFPPYGPVPDEKRRPLRHWKPESHPLERPMLSTSGGSPQPITSYKLLNRSTEREKPERAAGEKNRLASARLDIGPTRQRMAPPAVDELIREIDEEESNRLNVMDGYSPRPPRPREGFGLQLRPQHDDINEIFTGPKWYDPRGIRRSPPYLEVVESRPIPPPTIIKKPKREVRSQEVGDKVDRPTLKRVTPEPDRVFKAKKIRFKGYWPQDWAANRPAEFLDRTFIDDIEKVAKRLRDDPDVKVRVRANVSEASKPWFYTEEDMKNWMLATMQRRGEAIEKQLWARGIDPKRIATELGSVGKSDDDRNVEFFFDVP